MVSRFWGAAVILLLLFSAGGATAADSGTAGPAWIDDYARALQLAKEQDKLLVIDFYTSWCQYCKALEKKAFGDPKVVPLTQKFVMAKLDAEVAKAAASRYQPEGFPTVVIATSEGEEILRFSGSRTAEQVYTVLEGIVRVGPELAANLRRAGQDKKNFRAREAVGKAYLELGITDLALEQLQLAAKAAKGAPQVGSTGAESDQARIQMALSQAALREEDFRLAAQTLEKLIQDNPTSPRLEEYFLGLEQAYTAWGKTDHAAAVRTRRQKQFPPSKPAGAA